MCVNTSPEAHEVLRKTKLPFFFFYPEFINLHRILPYRGMAGKPLTLKQTQAAQSRADSVGRKGGIRTLP